ncbi:uncharacterized protein N7477_007133 [Penicillium maclennaniae]|uniref:uncharacterized protein n=1 Tax=Penicillium maclennaniae TaxID=1343394 RepID=UPI002542470F|nr:uncharacterized protein N7477_007133 [Penicillium maclennaniae]KAJ5668563.1 hypothetical protein N7477_007133 [Penicillium maclennaniae]
MDSIAFYIRQLALHELHAGQRNFAHALRFLTSPSALPHLTGLLPTKVPGMGIGVWSKDSPLEDG